MNPRGPKSSRRAFLIGAGGLTIAGTMVALHLRHRRQAEDAQAGSRASAGVTGPYGPIAPVADLETGLALLHLPAGFEYRSYSWSGDPMSDGSPTPDAHDGMGVIATGTRDGETECIIVRNHERSYGHPIAAPAIYDRAADPAQSPGGGTTHLRFRGGRWQGAEASLGGTLINCGGGVTPWGSWLSCEEIMADLTASGGRRHGYVFEVRRDPAATTGRPIVDMGRMMHEAVAIDPATNYAYLTEDNPGVSAFYRFIPHDASGVAGSYENGGRLQAARVVGRANASLIHCGVDDEYAVEWIDLADPDSSPAEVPGGIGGTVHPASGPFTGAWSHGALRLSRGEGICHHGGKFFLVDTTGGAPEGEHRGLGSVWEYDPVRETLRALYVAGSAPVGDHPDNLTVSPRGGILLCEDNEPSAFAGHERGCRLLGLTSAGDSYVLARNAVVLTAEEIDRGGKRIEPGDYRGEEWAGACFDAAGEWLFVNIQRPGITFAIRGPWHKGNL